VANPFGEIDTVIEFMQGFSAEKVSEKIKDGSLTQYEKEMHLMADLLEENAAILQNSLRYIGRG
jgi:hypothetical protein